MIPTLLTNVGVGSSMNDMKESAEFKRWVESRRLLEEAMKEEMRIAVLVEASRTSSESSTVNELGSICRKGR
jgi:hypothetical protein